MTEEYSSTEKGWPRPVIGGRPIPWVSPPENLRMTHPERMEEIVECGLCQVCGEVPDREEDVYLLINLALGVPPEGSDLAEKTLQAMDNAMMHKRCYELATSNCPVLRSLDHSKTLAVYRTQWKKVRVYDCSDPFLGVDGKDVERVR
jgi:hypothetical protein